MKLELNIPDNASCDYAAVEARREWLRFHRIAGESLPVLAARLGISYRQARYWDQKTYANVPLAPDSTIEFAIDGRSGCVFCGSMCGLHQHHVINRHESHETVELCSECHKLFHLLNNLYRRRIKPA